MRRTAGVGLLLVCILSLGYGLGMTTGPRVQQWIRGGTPAGPGKGEGKPPDDQAVFALGKLQPAAGVISVFGPAGDRVKELKVTQGRPVSRGEPLAVLASADDRQKEVDLAAVQLAEAEKQLAAIGRSRAVRLAEIAQQVAGLKAARDIEARAENLKIGFAKRQLAAAEAQQRRLANLDPTVVRVSPQERDQADLAVSQARSELRAAETASEAAKKKHQLALETAETQKKVVEAESDLARGRVPTESLKQSLALANLRVERSTLKSPVDGTVLRVLTREGDTTGPEPILQIASGTRMVAAAEVYAADVKRLRGWLEEGKTVAATVTSPALGGSFKLSGELSGPNAIAHAVARNTVPGFNPRADSDRRVVEVRVLLDEAASAQASRFVGLEVEVELAPK